MLETPRLAWLDLAGSRWPGLVTSKPVPECTDAAFWVYWLD